MDINPVYPLPGAAQSSRMEEYRPKHPKSPVGYIVLVAIAVLAAVLVVRPLGAQITGVFQRLVEAFQHGR